MQCSSIFFSSYKWIIEKERTLLAGFINWVKHILTIKCKVTSLWLWRWAQCCARGCQNISLYRSTILFRTTSPVRSYYLCILAYLLKIIMVMCTFLLECCFSDPSCMNILIFLSIFLVLFLNCSLWHFHVRMFWGIKCRCLDMFCLSEKE